MAGVKFEQVCNREREREVNATQILCDLYIDIVPTVLLNNIWQYDSFTIACYKNKRNYYFEAYGIKWNATIWLLFYYYSLHSPFSGHVDT